MILTGRLILAHPECWIWWPDPRWCLHVPSLTQVQGWFHYTETCVVAFGCINAHVDRWESFNHQIGIFHLFAQTFSLFQHFLLCAKFDLCFRICIFARQFKLNFSIYLFFVCAKFICIWAFAFFCLHSLYLHFSIGLFLLAPTVSLSMRRCQNEVQFECRGGSKPKVVFGGWNWHLLHKFMYIRCILYEIIQKMQPKGSISQNHLIYNGDKGKI